MATLYDVIRYDDKLYDDCSDDEGKNEIAELAFKLSSIEEKILGYNKCYILISAKGIIMPCGYPEELKGEIGKLATSPIS